MVSAMDESFESTFITLTDEEGNEIELEYLDTLEYNGAVYMSFFPTIPEDEADSAEDNDDYGMIILKVVSDNGDEEELVTIENEAELNAVYDLFMEALFEDEDDEE
ncbi:MAG: DUF1292 domain-containing protein [Oscillospiraceae bacterium]|nr:DUF1292 domain-containing protein [Oscillospiraceae bacterium]